jgi:uncharacterized integral membrane protein
MKPRSTLTVAIVALVGLFAIANWGTLAAHTTLSLLVAQVEAPLGIVMLMLLAAIMFVYLALLALAESRHASAQRRMVREMERLRRLAEQSEESRYGELRAYVEAQFAALDAKLDRIASQQAVMPPDARAEAALPQPDQTHSHPTLRGS